MKKPKQSAKELTDEEVLKEFVSRFQCDGAVLIYCEAGTEYGFSRWTNKEGAKWTSDLFKRLRQEYVWKANNEQPSQGGTFEPIIQMDIIVGQRETGV